MAYRLTTIRTIVADDSEMTRKYFDATATLYQSLDKEAVVKIVRIGTADADAEVSLSPLATAKYVEIRSDYPVRYRWIGSGSAAAATQMTLVGQGVAAVNQGAPLPDKCVAIITGNVTSLYLQPIASAAQTANVTVIASGDPVSDYTGG